MKILSLSPELEKRIKKGYKEYVKRYPNKKDKLSYDDFKTAFISFLVAHGVELEL